MERHIILLKCCLIVIVLFLGCQTNTAEEEKRKNEILADSLYTQGVKLMEQEKDPYALQFFTKAVALAPDNALYHLDRGVAHMNVMEFEKSLKDFEKVLQIDSANVKALFNMAVSLNNLEEFDKSIDYSTKAIELNPSFGMLYFMRGESYLFKKDTTRMCQEYSIALKNGCREAMERMKSYCIKTKETTVDDLPSFLKFTPKQ